ncbi:MAG: alpha/beta hydrolase, partial [Actinomycetota bacterium]
MATFVLLHGAGSDSWYWHLVEPELRARGHETVAVDLPCGDDDAGLAEYTDTVVEAVGGATDVVLVAQSMAGFTAPLVCERVPVALMVLVAAMVPAPGERLGDWWANTGHQMPAGDAVDVFLHDVPAEIAEESVDHVRDQSGTPFEEVWPLAAWPAVATRFLLCRDDRFFPPDFLRRVVRDR